MEAEITNRETPRPRRSRADGQLSRARILDAASEIAAERGYEGTSIALVSANADCLPAPFIGTSRTRMI
jgi:AcrR family transcriptional regulator